jgi:light-regulated signal transduction histidine kinase (bacteriophytochrome)
MQDKATPENCRIERREERRLVGPRISEGCALLLGALLAGGIAAATSHAVDWGPSGAPLTLGLLGAAAFLAGAGLAIRNRGNRSGSANRGAQREAALGAALEQSVAHDLRSPLGAIMNFTSVLEEDLRDRLDDEARAILARIRRAAASALLLLDGLSRLARAGRDPLCLEPVDMEQLVREVFAELASDQRSVELAVGRLPVALADVRLLRIALRELIANALKFSATREKIRIQVEGGRGRDGTLVYHVVDEGVGFEMRFASKLFAAFERLHPRDEFPGAGVGLAIVRRVVERHGGRTWVDAELDRGARFSFSLPARPEVAG